MTKTFKQFINNQVEEDDNGEFSAIFHKSGKGHKSVMTGTIGHVPGERSEVKLKSTTFPEAHIEAKGMLKNYGKPWKIHGYIHKKGLDDMGTFRSPPGK